MQKNNTTGTEQNICWDCKGEIVNGMCFCNRADKSDNQQQGQRVKREMMEAAKAYSSNSTPGFVINDPVKYRSFRDGQDSGYNIAQQENEKLQAENTRLREALVEFVDRMELYQSSEMWDNNDRKALSEAKEALINK